MNGSRVFIKLEIVGVMFDHRAQLPRRQIRRGGGSGFSGVEEGRNAGWIGAEDIGQDQEIGWEALRQSNEIHLSKIPDRARNIRNEVIERELLQAPVCNRLWAIQIHGGEISRLGVGKETHHVRIEQKVVNPPSLEIERMVSKRRVMSSVMHGRNGPGHGLPEKRDHLAWTRWQKRQQPHVKMSRNEIDRSDPVLTLQILPAESRADAIPWNWSTR